MFTVVLKVYVTYYVLFKYSYKKTSLVCALKSRNRNGTKRNVVKQTNLTG